MANMNKNKIYEVQIKSKALIQEFNSYFKGKLNKSSCFIHNTQNWT